MVTIRLIRAKDFAENINQFFITGIKGISFLRRGCDHHTLRQLSKYRVRYGIPSVSRLSKEA